MKSNHEYELLISQEAFEDLIDIQNYTYTVHGEPQWKHYEDLLDKALLQILEHPFSGHAREDIPEGYRAWNVGQHVMIYRVFNHIVYLIRVLHGKMDFTFQF